MNTARTLVRVPAVCLSAALLLAVSACGGDESGSEEGSSAQGDQGATTPGEASCEFDGDLSGSATVTETDTSFDVTFTGQPVHDESRSIYDIALADESFAPVSLQVRFDEGQLSGFGVTDQDANFVEVEGEPQVEGDTISASFPKSAEGLADLEPTQWRPDVTFLDDGGKGQCEDGRFLPFEG